MPVLEAMAAGLAVVATACLGVDTFARHGMNALLAAPQVSCTSCSAFHSAASKVNVCTEKGTLFGNHLQHEAK